MVKFLNRDEYEIFISDLKRMKDYISDEDYKLLIENKKVLYDNWKQYRRNRSN